MQLWPTGIEINAQEVPRDLSIVRERNFASSTQYISLRKKACRFDWISIRVGHVWNIINSGNK